MTCELCSKPSYRSAVIRGTYHRALCREHYDSLVHNNISSGQAEYERGRNHEEQLANIIQPYDGDGKPSAEFAKLYPTQAKNMFGEDGMRSAERS